MIASIVFAAVNLCPIVNAPVYSTLPAYDEEKVCSTALLEAGCPGCSQAIQWAPSGGQYEQILRCEGDLCFVIGNTAYWNHYHLEPGGYIWDRVISYWYPSWDALVPEAGKSYLYWHRPCDYTPRICEGGWLGMDGNAGIPYVAITTALYYH